MKAQFKYAFLIAFNERKNLYVLVLGIMLIMIIPGAFGLLPQAALITAVSIGGVGIAVVFFGNIVGDVSIFKRLFDAPEAYINALAPVHRGKTLAASVTAITVLDVISLALVIAGEVVLGLLLAASFNSDSYSISYSVAVIGIDSLYLSDILDIIGSVLLLIMAYLTFIMLLLFCSALKRSVFYQKPAGGLLTFLSGIGAVYIFSLSQLLLAPFGAVYREGLFFTVHLSGWNVQAYTALLFAAACILFVITSKLMERKINI